MAVIDNSKNPREELAAKLQQLDELFEREMRARGFDPSQAENVALTSRLARLYAAREQLREELADLESPVAVNQDLT
jgi:hypothetical protein